VISEISNKLKATKLEL